VKRLETLEQQRVVLAAPQPRRVPARQPDHSFGQLGPVDSKPALAPAELGRFYASGQRIVNEPASEGYLSISKIFRGWYRGNWENAQHEYRISALTTGAADSTLPISVFDRIIDLARYMSVVAASGTPTFLIALGDGSQVKIPEITADPTVSWVAELAPIPMSCPTISGVTVIPKKAGVICQISWELIEDAGVVAIDQQIERVIAQAIAQEVDRVSLIGNGTAEPAGILNTAAYPDVPPISIAGATPVAADLLKAYYSVVAAHYNPTSSILPFAWTQAYAGGTDTLGQPLRAPDAIKDLPIYPTSKLTAAGVVGDWANGAIMVFKRKITVARSDQFAFDKDCVTLRGTVRYALGVLRQQAFAALTPSGAGTQAAQHERKANK
jgi:HK97 family phage major capsid protein